MHRTVVKHDSTLVGWSSRSKRAGVRFESRIPVFCSATFFLHVLPVGVRSRPSIVPNKIRRIKKMKTPNDCAHDCCIIRGESGTPCNNQSFRPEAVKANVFYHPKHLVLEPSLNCFTVSRNTLIYFSPAEGRPNTPSRCAFTSLIAAPCRFDLDKHRNMHGPVISHHLVTDFRLAVAPSGLTWPFSAKQLEAISKQTKFHPCF